MRPLAADVFRSCPRADNVRISDHFLRYPDRNGYCLQLHADQHITDINTCMRLHMLYGDSGGYPSYASAAAILLFAIVLTITCINLLVSKKHVHYV